jgi:hypothetical protein
MPNEVKAYKCNWCSRCFAHLSHASIHEKACKNNPARRNCKTCIHGHYKPIPCYPYDTTEQFGVYCAYHNVPMGDKPYFIECDERQACSPDEAYYYELDPDDLSYPLPGTCHHYEYKGKAEWTRDEEQEDE